MTKHFNLTLGQGKTGLRYLTQQYFDMQVGARGQTTDLHINRRHAIPGSITPSAHSYLFSPEKSN